MLTARYMTDEFVATDWDVKEVRNRVYALHSRILSTPIGSWERELWLAAYRALFALEALDQPDWDEVLGEPIRFSPERQVAP